MDYRHATSNSDYTQIETSAAKQTSSLCRSCLGLGAFLCAPGGRQRRWPTILGFLCVTGLAITGVVFLALSGGVLNQDRTADSTADSSTASELHNVSKHQGLLTTTATAVIFRGAALTETASDCSRRADCSSHGDCINGECRCDTGFSGEKCQVGSDGHCSRRADCGDHGDCVNSECQCDEGFSGPRCEVGGCTLRCQHGGVPDHGCSMCECLGGWTGATCAAWDDQYSAEAFLHHIETLSTAAEAEQEREMASDMPPLPAALGTGVNRRTGRLGLPIVSLQYDRTVVQKQWTNSKGQTFVIADETTFETTSGKSSDFFAMRTLDQLHTKNDEMRTRNQGWAGVLETWLTKENAEEIHAQYLEMPDRAFYLYREIHPVFKMTLPLNKGTFREYPLHALALKALHALPDTCESDGHKKMYQLFADTWGTSYTTSATLGGLLEVAVRTRFCGVSESVVQGTIVQDKPLAFGGSGSATPGYAPWRDVIKAGLLGGVTEGVEDESTWLDSIHDSPATISFEYGAVADLITDPVKRACMQKQAAIEDGTRAKVPAAVAAAVRKSMAAYAEMKRSVHARPSATKCPNSAPPEQNLDMVGAQKAPLVGPACTAVPGKGKFGDIFRFLNDWNVNLYCEKDGIARVRAVADGRKKEKRTALDRTDVNTEPTRFPKPRPLIEDVSVNEEGDWVSAVPKGMEEQCSETIYGQCCVQCTPLH